MTIDCPELTDPGPKTLVEWGAIIICLIAVYGNDAVLDFDAGHNNITAKIIVPDDTLQGIFAIQSHDPR